ncbi:MAG: hypothetical protein IJU40_07275, partial [Desulfovibrionaceae bacterium]|nr:hypothetical protein [Desulfovibrionaceae bacterium]
YWALRSKRLNLNSYIPDFPLNKPHDFEASTFILPHNLLTTSFQPTRLLKSCFKRLYLNLKERIKGF